MWSKFCSLQKIFLYKILYTPRILHIPIPLNTLYNRWNTQFITYIRKHRILAHHLNRYDSPHKLPTSTSVSSLEHWLLFKDYPSFF